MDKNNKGQEDLNPTVKTKIDEALSWVYKAKETSRKAIQNCNSQSPLVSSVKAALKGKMEELVSFQLKLEEFKTFGSGNLQDVKRVLSGASNGLVEIQEAIRALSAMG